MLIDSHCHIPIIEGEGGSRAIIDAALAGGIGHMLCVCIDLDSYPDILQLADAYPCISASVGIHPNSQVDEEPTPEQLVDLARNPSVVAIGETGLDYFRSSGDLEWQRQRFRTHIRAAIQAGKPLIIHSRDAGEDTIRLMHEENAAVIGGVMHCFTYNWEMAKRAIDVNFYISFSGIVTFKNARELKQVAKNIPLDKLLIETDSPYLAPVPFRGKQNQPAYVRHVAEHIAELRGVSFDTVARASTDNFCRLFSHANVFRGQFT